MKKTIYIILLIFIIVLVITIQYVYNYRSAKIAEQKINNEYNSYYNKQVLGTELISIINRTIDVNNQNGIAKDNNYYIDNENNSIQIYVVFVYKDKTKTIKMEDIEKSGTEAFIKRYSTESFKCTNIDNHKKTKNVKSLTFEEVTNE